MILLGQNHLNAEVGMRNAENLEQMLDAGYRCQVSGVRIKDPGHKA
jgi:hypothetical protein